MEDGEQVGGKQGHAGRRVARQIKVNGQWRGIKCKETDKITENIRPRSIIIKKVIKQYVNIIE